MHKYFALSVGYWIQYSTGRIFSISIIQEIKIAPHVLTEIYQTRVTEIKHTYKCDFKVKTLLVDFDIPIIA